ncbi:AraC family transcriptional regulator [Anaerosolibacter carboniphilus]|uniref:AraC family transcriptional regulator n=1 Tax=Anaerosolibacter carboniphilus TaxID=1417629 RepID=A0A841KQZ8_9FIRM|nr:helix-turn-helix transcriptional regulator [Anaerosolibacter carboniphilus]MBB6214520.1 AraC family transcriptional regulator [Anaerosolibacter carboniphilus]
MDYIYLIENTIKYIEESLEEELTLDSLSERCYLSKYYFHRIFSAVMGCSLIEYIKQRRLNKALTYVLDTSEPIVNIAYRLQFGSQASFTRAFKNNYGFPPGYVRKGAVKLSPTPVPAVLKRALKNFNSDVVTDFTFVEEEQQVLIGFYMDVDLSDQDIQYRVNRKAKAFLQSVKPKDGYNAFAIYFQKTSELENKCIHTFFGIGWKAEDENLVWPTYKLPNMLYAKFRYTGDLLYIGDMVVRDLKRWMTIAKIEMVETEISFIQAYDQTYQEDGSFSLFLPIRAIPQGM